MALSANLSVTGIPRAPFWSLQNSYQSAPIYCSRLSTDPKTCHTLFLPSSAAILSSRALQFPSRERGVGHGFTWPHHCRNRWPNASSAAGNGQVETSSTSPPPELETPWHSDRPPGCHLGPLLSATSAVTEVVQRMRMPVIFVIWFGSTAVFSIYNKKVLNVLPLPWTTSSLCTTVGALGMLLLWTAHAVKWHCTVTGALVRDLAPVALFQTLGYVASVTAVSKVAVSFALVIRAAEPVFSVVLQSLLGARFSPLVFLSLLPIVGGCATAAATELSFSRVGFVSALLANLAFVVHAALGKQTMQRHKMGGLNLYGWVTSLSLVLLLPAALVLEGHRWVATWSTAVARVGTARLLTWLLVQSLAYHVQYQVSYMALAGITPLTFSVASTLKRVVVIVSSVLVFRNPISPLNAAGSAMAILGTFLYSQTQPAPQAK